jgi:hypothetical protein
MDPLLDSNLSSFELKPIIRDLSLGHYDRGTRPVTARPTLGVQATTIPSVPRIADQRFAGPEHQHQQ